MGDMRKITAFIPRELLATAQEYTGAGVSETLRIALERLARDQFYRRMRELREKGVTLDLNLDALREDREFDAQGDVIR
jgi:hypothetical protein